MFLHSYNVDPNDPDKILHRNMSPVIHIRDIGAKFISMVNTLKKTYPNYDPPKLGNLQTYIPDAGARGIRLVQAEEEALNTLHDLCLIKGPITREFWM